jgi:hypothetical protein
MIDERFVVLAALINVFGSLLYALSTLKGKTQPNRVTWFLWAINPLIAFAAQVGEGAYWIALMTFMVGFGPALVLTASFLNKNAYWKITRFDSVCGILSVLAIALWIITGTGIIAIWLSIVADLFAGLPTLVKAWRFPETEDHRAFRNAGIGAVITLLTVQKWQFSQYGFALYIFIICSVFYILIRLRPQQRIG